MQQVGVETRGLQRDAKRPTRQVDVLRDAHGDRHFGGFGGQATSDFADTALTSTVIPADLFGSAEALVFGTITLAFAESRAALEHCLTLATQQGLRRVLDLNWRPMFWPDPTLAVDRIAALLPQVDLLKLAAAEAALFFKTTDPGAIARQWPLLRLVLVTDGAQGCHWWSQGEVGFTPAFTVTAVDTTGAGDSFLAAVLHQITQRGLGCLAEAKSVREIVRYASAAGALTTLQAGAIAAQPSAAEVDAFLQQP
jgi:fructokinase